MVALSPMSIGDHQLDAGEAPAHQIAREARPERLGFGGADGHRKGGACGRLSPARRYPCTAWKRRIWRCRSCAMACTSSSTLRVETPLIHASRMTATKPSPPSSLAPGTRESRLPAASSVSSGSACRAGCRASGRGSRCAMSGDHRHVHSGQHPSGHQHRPP